MILHLTCVASPQVKTSAPHLYGPRKFARPRPLNPSAQGRGLIGEGRDKSCAEGISSSLPPSSAPKASRQHCLSVSQAVSEPSPSPAPSGRGRARAEESFAVSLLFMARITFCMQRDENKPAGCGGGGGGNGVLGGEGRRRLVQAGEGRKEGKALVRPTTRFSSRREDGRKEGRGNCLLPRNLRF